MRISRFEVLQEIGRGPESVVYEVRDVAPASAPTSAPATQRLALKLLTRAPMGAAPDQDASGPPEDLESIAAPRMRAARFRREFTALELFHHQNIVRVLELGEDEGLPFFTMELVEGMAPGQWLARVGGLQAPARNDALVLVLQQKLAALDEIHGRGMTHRGLYPDNFVVAADGTVKLMGFAWPHSLVSDDIARRTLMYISPEAASGRDVDRRADLYSIGVVLYELLAGRHPFESDSAVTLAFHHARTQPPDIATFNPKVHVGLQGVCERLLRKNPDERYQTAAEVIAALNALRAEQTLVH